MSNRALLLLSGLALLSAGVPTTPEACLLATSLDHACCAGPTIEPTSENPSSCCSGPTTQERRDDSVECGCIHAPDNPAASPSASPTPSWDPETSIAVDHRSTQPALVDGSASCRRGSAADRRAHSPPPVFLLDCAFLI